MKASATEILRQVHDLMTVAEQVELSSLEYRELMHSIEREARARIIREARTYRLRRRR